MPQAQEAIIKFGEIAKSQVYSYWYTQQSWFKKKTLNVKKN